MIKNIVVLHGSPRSNSTSSYFAHYFCEQIANKVAIQHFYLHKLNYKGCIACNACQTVAEKCVVQDNLTEVLEVVRQADLWVIASPIYFDSLSSLTMAFLERCQGFYSTNFLTRPDKSRLHAGKKLVVITSGEQKLGKFYTELCDRIRFHFKIFGFESSLFLGIDQMKADDNPATKKQFLEELRRLARTINDDEFTQNNSKKLQIAVKKHLKNI